MKWEMPGPNPPDELQRPENHEEHARDDVQQRQQRVLGEADLDRLHRGGIETTAEVQQSGDRRGDPDDRQEHNRGPDGPNQQRC